MTSAKLLPASRKFAETKASYAENDEILGLLRVLLGVSISHPELLEEFVRRYIVEVDDSLIPFLVAADAAGALRVPDAVMAAQVFWWLAGSALFWPATLGISLDPSARDATIDEVLATFLARFGVE